MALTSHAELRRWLILVLGDLGGSAQRSGALAAIEASFGGLLTLDDKRPQTSRPFETKWRNRVSWERDRMVKDGLLGPYERHGTPWQLIDQGQAVYRETWASTPDGAGDRMPRFKPKNSDDYLAHVSGRTLVKTRSHEALIKDFGEWCNSREFVADTDVHPRDLIVRRDDSEWLVEAKVVYAGDVTTAVRGALAQALMYRYLLHDAPLPTLVALFSESIGELYADFLESLKIGAVWRRGSGWDSSPSAACFAT